MSRTGSRIEAVACAPGMTSCGETTGEYTLRAAIPTFSVAPGTALPGTPSTPVLIETTTLAPSIIRYYDVPAGQTSPALDCSGAPLPGVFDVLGSAVTVDVTGGRQIGAIACKPGYEPSGVATAEYPLEP